MLIVTIYNIIFYDDIVFKRFFKLALDFQLEFRIIYKPIIFKGTMIIPSRKSLSRIYPLKI